MFKPQFAAVRRYILLLLLAVLPLQTTWAAVASCPRAEHQGDHASGPNNTAHADAGDRHGATDHADHGHPHGDRGTTGHSGGPGLDCSLFQFVAVEPFDMAPQSVSPPGVALMDIVFPGYKSHVPDGLERPNWRLAA